MEVTNRRPPGPDLELQKKQKRADQLKRVVQTIEEIGEGLKSPLWLHIKDRMMAKMKAIDDRQYDYENPAVTDRSIIGSLGEKKCAMEILGIEEFINGRERFEAELDTLQKEIRELLRLAPTGRK